MIFFCDAVEKAMDYISSELQKWKQRHEPELLRFYLESWYRSWFKWSSEIICDLFAVFSIGAAFVWSSLHYCLQYGENPYLLSKAPSSHPPFGVRINAMTKALRLIGLNQDADKIENFWGKYVKTSSYNITAEYYRCFPEFLVVDIVEKAKSAVDAINCSLIIDRTEENIRTILNKAWEVFWDQPNQYVSWERDQIRLLEKKYCQDNIAWPKTIKRRC